MVGCCSTADALVAGRPLDRLIACYAPCCVSGPAACFTRDVVASAAPVSLARARAWLFAASRLAVFAESVGLELRADRLLSGVVIERFVACGCDGFSPATVRTLRTSLRALARACEPCPVPLPVPLCRERAKPPYSPAQIDGYLRLAGVLSSGRLRMRASALVCLGAGAGVIAGELRGLRGSDVVERCGGVLVNVGGRRARSVPVLARYQQPLLEAARFASDGLIVGGRAPGRHNITDSLVQVLSTDRSLPRLQAGRLRSTWLCVCAQHIGLHGFMHAAGIRCSQRLGDLAASLPAVSEAELLTLFGGWR